MKLTSSFNLAGWILIGTLVSASAAPIDSRVSAVTVYPDRAVVTRLGTVTLETGTTELVLERLPASLNDASLQVSGRGTASVTILDVSVRQSFVEASPSMRVRALEDELAGLRRQDGGIAESLLRVAQQQTLVERIEVAMTAPPSGDTPRALPSFDDWQRLLTFQADQLARLSNERQTLTRQREELAQKTAAVEQQLIALRGQQPGGRSYKSVLVRVAAATAGELNLTVAYTVPGASWTPAYDARLRSDSRRIDFTYHGVVRNGTGEDWNNVALTLSTARPGLGGGAPEVPDWIVDQSRPMPLALAQGVTQLDAFQVTGYGSRERAQAEPPAAAKAERDTAVAIATVESAATSATFRIAEPVTLPSDNSTQKVAITSLPLPATLTYEIAPKLREAAFLTAKATNGGEFPFLAGAVNAFLDDTFVATSRMKTVMPGESFDLALGADEGIAVKRRLVNRLSENTGLTNSGRRVTYDVIIALTNNKRSAERLVIREAVPVSRHEKIVVKLLAPSEREIGTTAAPKDIIRDEQGRLVWTVELKPGEKRDLPFKVSIDHPADMAVSGLD